MPAPRPGHDTDRLLTTAEAAQLLGGVTDRTLRNWAAAGTGPRRLRVGGRHVRYRHADLLAWLDTQYVAATA